MIHSRRFLIVVLLLTLGVSVAFAQKRVSTGRTQGGLPESKVSKGVKKNQLDMLRELEVSFLAKATQNPEGISEATVSFLSPVTAGSLDSMLSGSKIQILTLFHTVGNSGGGFRLNEGESFNDATAAIEVEYRKMLDELLGDRESLTKAYGDLPGVIEKYETELAAVRTAVEAHSIPYYGMQLRGRNSELTRLKQNPNVGLILSHSEDQLPEPIRF